MSELPDQDAVSPGLHEAGRSIGDAALVGPAGSLVWLVNGHDGGRTIRAAGATRDEAWREAVRQAELIGAAGRNGDAP